MEPIHITREVSSKMRDDLTEKLELSRYFMEDYVRELTELQAQYMLDNWRSSISDQYVTAFSDFFDDFIRDNVPDLE